MANDRWVEYNNRFVNLSNIDNIYANKNSKGWTAWFYYAGDSDGSALGLETFTTQSECKQFIRDVIAGKYDMEIPTNFIQVSTKNALI